MGLKDRFFADPFNPVALIIIGSFVAVIPQALKALVGWLGWGSVSLLNTLTGVADDAVKVAAVIFGLAFLLFFLRRR